MNQELTFRQILVENPERPISHFTSTLVRSLREGQELPPDPRSEKAPPRLAQDTGSSADALKPFPELLSHEERESTAPCREDVNYHNASHCKRL